MREDSNSKKKKILLILLLLLLFALFFIYNGLKQKNEHVYIKAFNQYLKGENVKAKDGMSLSFEELISKGYLKKSDYKEDCPKTSTVTLKLSKSKKDYSFDFTCENKSIVAIDLNKGKKVVLNYGDDYIEYGASAAAGDVDLSSKVKIDSSNFNKYKVGKYKVVYSVTFEGKTVNQVRYVYVVDKIKPVISLYGNKTIKIAFNGKYVEPGYSVRDNADGDITNKVKVRGSVNAKKLGTYSIYYSVNDKSGNKAVVKRIVKIYKPKVIKVSKNKRVSKKKSSSNKKKTSSKTNSGSKTSEGSKKPSNPSKPVEAKAPSLTLKGANVIYLEYPNSYIEPGYSSYDSLEGDITSKVVVDSNVNTTKLGTYKVKYAVVNNKGMGASTSRTVIVRDTIKPSLNINGGNVIEINVGDSYSDLGASAVDNYDGDISSNIKVTTDLNVNKVGSYYVTYEVKDSSGNKAITQRKVNVVDRIKPVINVNDLTVTIERGDNFNLMSGVSATDNYDGNITSKIVSESIPAFDKDIAGNYVVKYNVVDSSGNAADEVVKTIVVKDTKAPIVDVDYSTTEPTNKPVKVTISGNEDIVIDGWTCVGKVCEKDFVANETNTVKVKDLAGNETDATYKIENIDTTGIIASVSYEPSSLTNKDVVATIITNKEIKIPNGFVKVTDTKYTKSYSENVEKTLEIEDKSGNTTEVEIKIDWIDKVAPVGSVEYSKTTSTTLPVKASITVDEDIENIIGWTKISSKVFEKEYSDNVEETITIKDLAGNSGSVLVKIDWIDKTPYEAVANYDKAATKNPVEVIITANKDTKDLVGWTRVDEKTFKKEYSVNYSGTITLEDLEGNTTTVDLDISNIDNVNPEVVGVVYSPDSKTNGNVTVTITFSEPVLVSGWTKVSDKVYSREFSENVTNHKIEFEDLVGNAASEKISIDWINKEAPVVVSKTYSTTEPTTGSVKVTITADKNVTITDWDCNGIVCTKDYSANVDEDVTLIDEYGNTTNTNVKIENIEREALEVIRTYSEKDPTLGPVVVTITANRELKDISGWTKSGDGKTLTKSFDDNVSTSVTVKDEFDNSEVVSIDIANIDKEGPVLDIKYSETNPTKDPVTVTIKTNEDVQSIAGWTKVNDREFTKEYSSNASEEVKVKDLLGNETTETITVNNIDKSAPIVEVKYSETNLTKDNVTVTLEANKEITVSGWNCSGKVCTKEFEENIEDTVIVSDKVGNTTEVEIVINNIDKSAPVIESIEYSTKELTMGSVEVTVTADKNITVDSWSCSGKVCKNTFNENVISDYIAKDVLGNEASFSVKIENIDKAELTVDVEYSETNPTNGDVIVTITGSRDLKDISGWTRVSGNKLEKSYNTNTTETVVVKDILDNSKSVEVKIENIDKSAPTYVIGYSPDSFTKGNVRVNIKPSEEIKPLAGWTKEADGSYSFEYQDNIDTNVLIEDLIGNETSVPVKIDWIDRIPPVIELKGESSVEVTINTAQYIDLGYVVSDNSNGPVEVTSTSNIDLSVAGEYEYTYTAVDAAGNSSTVTRTVKVLDNVKPKINVDKTTVSIYVTTPYNVLDGVSATDNVDGDITDKIEITWDRELDINVLGEYTATFRVCDTSGNCADPKKKKVIVTTPAPPIITVDSSNIYEKEVNTVKPVFKATAKDVEGRDVDVTITDNINMEVVGEYLVTFKAVDKYKGTCIEEIIFKVVDTTKPVIELNGSPSINLEYGKEYEELGATVTDNYDLDIQSKLEISDSVNETTVGTYTVYYNVVDSNGNVADTVTRTVNIVDTKKPVISVIPDTVTIEKEEDYDILTGVKATDNYDGDITSAIVTESDLNINTPGTYTVKYNVSDSSGNAAIEKVRTIIVKNSDEPTIEIDEKNVYEIEVKDEKPTYKAYGYDDEDGELEVIITDNINVNVIGPYTVTFKVKNSRNKEVIITKEVKVIDSEKPVISLIGDSEVEVLLNGSYTEEGVTLSDNYDSEAILRSKLEMVSDIDLNTPGTYFVTYNLSDSSGNIADTVIRTVRVVDNEKPVISVTELNKTINQGEEFNLLDGVSVTDNYDSNLMDKIVTDPDIIDTNIPSVYQITYDVSDSSGNAADTVTKELIILDTEGPVIKPSEDNIYKVKFGSEMPEIEATATDNVDGDVDVDITHDINLDNVGEYTITYKAKDDSGNESILTETFKVVDEDGPIIIINGDEEVYINLGEAYEDEGAIAYDDYDGELPVVVESNVNPNIIGNYEVKYSAVDSNGNETVVVREVIVRDNEAPVLTVDPLEVTVDQGEVYDLYTGVKAVDDLEGNLPKSNIIIKENVNFNVPGEYEVVYGAFDSSDNHAEEIIRKITVLDKEAPVITVDPNEKFVYEVKNSLPEFKATAIDNVDGKVNVAIDSTAVDMDTVGEYNVVYKAIDKAGNESEITRTVKVVDTTRPIIEVKPDVVFKNVSTTDYDLKTGVTVSDNYDNLTIDDVEISGDYDKETIGWYYIKYNVKDSSGNSAYEVTRVIVVHDENSPTITLDPDNPTEMEVHTEIPEFKALAVDKDGESVPVDITHEINKDKLGTYEIRFYAEDQEGNYSIEFELNFKVVDKTKPVIELKGESEIEIEYGTTYEELGAEVTDNYDEELNVEITSNLNVLQLGTYFIRYNAVDSNGNKADEVIRKVTVKNSVPPTLLLDSDKVDVSIGYPYNAMTGVSASDVVDGDITKLVVVNPGAIDTDNEGEIVIKYEVTNSAGNTSEATRTINVVPRNLTTLVQSANNCSTYDCKFEGNIKNNYVWYSGILWRILGTNPDGSVKMITEENITTAPFDKANKNFSSSQIKNWLNEHFYSKLYNADEYLVESNWCGDVRSNISSKETTCNSKTSAKVGLLTLDEYNIHRKDLTANFLNNKQRFVTMTPYTDTRLMYVNQSGGVSYIYPYNPYGIRPVINVKPNASITNGSGTLESDWTYNSGPFIIQDDREFNDLNKRNAGEYIKINDNLWRIKDIREDGTTEVVLDEIYNNTYRRAFDTGSPAPRSSFKINDNRNIGYTLNNEIFNNLFSGRTSIATNSKHHYGQILQGEDVLEKSFGNTYNVKAKLVLPRMGDMFSAQSMYESSLYRTWLINPSATTSNWYVHNYGYSSNASVTGTYGVKPVGVLKGNSVISSGTGTAYDPYDIALGADDENPEIELDGLAEMDVEVKTGYKEPGYTAIDNADGDITDEVTVTTDLDINTLGSYEVKYEVTDSSGNSNTVTRKVNVVDTTKPEIKVKRKVEYVSTGSTFNIFEGVSATDNYDSDINTKLVANPSTIDTSVAGTYEITYSVMDQSGNSALSVTKKIIVSETPIAGRVATDNDCSGEDETCKYPYNTTDNYVWYSGFMWRILGLNEDGSVKLITDENVTTLPNGGSSYENSQLKTYLENHFYESLNDKDNIIVDEKYCADVRTASGSKLSECGKTETRKVGLLTLDEYNLYRSNGTTLTTDHYLNNNTYWSLYSYNASNRWTARNNGNVSAYSPTYAYGIRPVINVKGDTVVEGGDGKSKDSPYKIKVDHVDYENEKVYERYLGEYVKLGSNTWRIMNKDEDNNVNLILDDYYKENNAYKLLAFGNDASNLSAVFKTTSTKNIGYYLKNTAIKNLVESSDMRKVNLNYAYKFGGYATGQDVLASSFAKTYSSTTSVALPRIGDIGTGVDGAGLKSWYITPSSTSYMYINNLNNNKIATQLAYYRSGYTTPTAYIKPVITLKKGLVVENGEGTKNKPYSVTANDTNTPTISLNGDDVIEVPYKGKYTELGATAIDIEDGDLSSYIEIESNLNTNAVGTYQVTYKVTDSANNTSTVTRSVKVIDVTAPVLTVTPSTVTLQIGGNYDLMTGVKAVDDIEGDIKSKVEISGSYDRDAEGSYTITYTVSDEAGNTSTKTRIIRVITTTLSSIVGATLDCNLGSTCYYPANSTDNYVWYSGNLWRVIRINSDGTLRLVSENVVGLASFGTTSTYTTSNARKWLNDYYYPMLDRNDEVITDSQFCVDSTTVATSKRETCTNKVTDKVGLISLDEFNIVKGAASTSYLKNTSYFTMTTPYSSNQIWAATTGAGTYLATANMRGMRPVIDVKDNVNIVGGDGTNPTNWNDAEGPYSLDNKQLTYGDSRITTRNNGDYIKIKDTLYRVVEVNPDGSVKIVSENAYMNSSSAFVTKAFNTVASVQNFRPNDSNNIAYFINNTVYNDLFSTEDKKMILKHPTWYNGEFLAANSGDVFNTAAKKTNPVISTGGLLHIYETFVPNDQSTKRASHMWTMSKLSTANNWAVRNSDYDYSRAFTSVHNFKPAFVLSRAAIVMSGRGYLSNPFELSISEDTTAPVISLKGESEVTHEVNTTYTDPGATAEDDHDGDITKELIADYTGFNPNKLGTQYITYKVTDQSGHETTSVRTINVVDSTPPTVTMSAKLDLPIGGQYLPMTGVKIIDNYDKLEDLNIEIDPSSINMDEIGSHNITYTVTDTNGNKTIKTRTINIVESALPRMLRDNAGCEYEGACWMPNNSTNNYVYYSGMLWKVIKVNSDNTISAITEDTLAQVAPGTSTTYPTSFTRKWLNNYFYKTLKEPNTYLTTTDTCYDLTTAANSARTTCTSKVTDNVGSLSIDEYNISSKGSATNFITNGSRVMLPNLYSAGNNNYLNTNGVCSYASSTYAYGIRPVVTFKASSPMIKGNGTNPTTTWEGEDSPFILMSEEDATLNVTKLGDRKVGEYVKINNYIYRIMENEENGALKVILDDVYKVNNTIQTMIFNNVNYKSSTLHSYLNTTVYNNLFPTLEDKNKLVSNGYYYEGDAFVVGQDVMTSALNKTNPFITTVSQPRLGEMFSGSSYQTRMVSKQTYHLLTTVGATKSYTNLYDYGRAGNLTSARPYRPVVYLRPNNVIKSGSGIYGDPYELTPDEDTTKPSIDLTGGGVITHEVNTTFTEPGYTATDNADGDITHRVIVQSGINTTVVGTYEIKYTVTDERGNTEEVTRTVKVQDTTKPVVTVNPDTLSVPKDSSFDIKYGVKATDNYDNDVNGKIVANPESVDTSVIGNTNVEYYVIDSEGNRSESVYRTIKVVDSGLTTMVRSDLNCESGSCYYQPDTKRNFVWYSGILWRILKVNEDGSLRLMANDAVAIAPIGTGKTYANSFTREWLNNYFYNNLDEPDKYLVDGEFCSDTTTDYTANRSTCTNKFNDKVGLISIDEYNKIKGASATSYLLDVSRIQTMTPYSATNFIYITQNAYSGASLAATDSAGIRPIITFKPEVSVSSGNGILNSIDNNYTESEAPYVIRTKPEIVKNETKLNERSIGEYVEINDRKYRIVEFEEDGSATVTLNGLYNTETRAYSSNSTQVFKPDDANTIAHYLKNTVFNNLFKDSDRQYIKHNAKWYQGEAFAAGLDVNTTSLAKTSPFYADITLPRSGEMFSSPTREMGAVSYYWTRTKSTTVANMIAEYAYGRLRNVASSTAYRMKPSVQIVRSAFITDGSGTYSDPFKLNAIDDDEPTITLKGNEEINLEVHSTYSDLGATAFDETMGDISSRIIVDTSELKMNKLGSYNVKYTVSDIAGHSATKIRKVNVVDTTKPVVNIVDKKVYITKGDEVDLTHDVTITDNYDTDFTNKLTVTPSSINTNNPGTYTVSYVATDDSGNESIPVERTVVVSENNIGELAKTKLNCSDGSSCFYSAASTDNYVWYSGILWRIVKVNSDGSIRLVTDDAMTVISAGANATYSSSYVRNWLNDYFYNKLSNKEYITDGQYCSQTSTVYTNVRTTCSTPITDKVGLLSSDEYNLAGGTDSYLDIKRRFFTMTPYNASNFHYVTQAGAVGGLAATNIVGIRPVINLKADTIVTTGNGKYIQNQEWTSFNKPYVIKDDKPTENENLSSRNIGEYVKINNNIWQISDVKDGKPVLVKYEMFQVNNAVYKRTFHATAGMTTFNPNDANSLPYYLNNTAYDNLFTASDKEMVNESATWYQGELFTTGNNYTNSLTESNPVVAKVGLPRIGEMFSSNNKYTVTKTADYQYLMTRSTTANVTAIRYYDLFYSVATTAVHAFRPKVQLKESVKIEKGTGTFVDPFELKN